MNIDVDAAIKNGQPAAEIDAVIQRAIKQHRRYSRQKGSNPLHLAVVAGLWTLLAQLRTEHPELRPKKIA